MQHTVEMYPVPYTGTILGFCTGFGSIGVVLQDILDANVSIKEVSCAKKVLSFTQIFV